MQDEENRDFIIKLDMGMKLYTMASFVNILSIMSSLFPLPYTLFDSVFATWQQSDWESDHQFQIQQSHTAIFLHLFQGIVDATTTKS